MPGFFVGNMGPVELVNRYADRCVQDSFEVDGFFCARSTLDAFLEDKAFSFDERFACVAEGVLLNKVELFARYGADCMSELLVRAYEARGDAFFEEFRGSFSGALLDRAEGKWVVYTNHCGDNAVFYHAGKQGEFCFGSQVNYVLAALKGNAVPVTLCDQAAYAMLTYGFMIDDSTYVNEVKRLLPGHYAIAGHQRGLETKRYYSIKGNQLDLSGMAESELVDELDARFRKAVERGFAKDAEYGKRHLCDLSGGLDSRMTTWVAHDLGYTDCLNVTFCQTGYLDETISAQIASHLGNEMLFMPLDGGNFLLDPERVISMSFGLGLYSGIGCGELMLNDLRTDDFGCEHTGQLGVVIGSYLENPRELAGIGHAGMYSSRLLGRLAPPDSSAYADREEYLLFTRGFLGMLSTFITRRNHVEVLSPFLDVDLMDFCMSIPPEQRMGHRLYKAWVLAKYPGAAEFVWEKERVKLTASPLRRSLMKAYRGGKYLMRRYLPSSLYAPRSLMSPVEHWCRTNPAIKESLDEAFSSSLDAVACDERLHSDLSLQYHQGSITEKVQVITALLSARYYLGYGSFR